MKATPRVRGKIVTITKQDAEVGLDDGRKGFVPTTDYFWDEVVSKRNLSAGDSLEFDVLGLKPDGRVSLGFEPIGEKGEHLVGIDVQYVTSLEEVRAECPGEVSNIERHPLFEEEDDEGCAGWVRVARLLESCTADGGDEDDEVDEKPEDENNDELEDEDVDEPQDDGTGDSADESRQLEDELLDLTKNTLQELREEDRFGADADDPGLGILRPYPHASPRGHRRLDRPRGTVLRLYCPRHGRTYRRRGEVLQKG